MSLACMFKQRMSDIQQLIMQYDRRSPQSHIAAWRKRSTLAKMPNTFQIFFGGYLDSPNFLQEVVEAAGRVRKVVNGRRCHHLGRAALLKRACGEGSFTPFCCFTLYTANSLS